MHTNALFLIHLDLGLATVVVRLIFLPGLIEGAPSLVAATLVHGSAHVRVKFDFNSGNPFLFSLLLLWYIVV